MVHTPHIAPAKANKKALILPGGGMRVAYQAGAVQALHEAGLRFSYADGTSGGLMNLAALLSGGSPEHVAKQWRTLRPSLFISPLSFRKYLSFPNLPSFGDFDGMRNKVYPHLGIDCTAIRKSKGVQAAFNVCDFKAKDIVPVPHTEIELQTLLAGMSLPLFTPAVEHEGKTWTDAVWIKDANVLHAVKSGANEIWIIWCIGNTAIFKPGFLNQYVHMIEMSAIGALNAELAEIKRINQKIEAGETPFGHTSDIKVHLIKPPMPIPLDPDYITGKVRGNALVDQGYMDASKYLASKPLTGSALDVTATQTPTAKPGLSFRETMKGRVSFYTQSPQEGGMDKNAIPISLNATINIRDIKAFVADPGHRSKMAAHLHSPRLGSILPATESNFQLFSPTGDPKHVEMIYELGFTYKDKPHWFSGKKAVRRGPPWRLWRDTTTLHVKIHEGTSTTGQVVAAGILRLGLFDFMSLITTVYARDCVGLFSKLKSIGTFAGFFLSRLWRFYGLGYKNDKS